MKYLFSLGTKLEKRKERERRKKNKTQQTKIRTQKNGTVHQQDLATVTQTQHNTSHEQHTDLSVANLKSSLLSGKG